MKSNGIYKKEDCVARKHLKNRGSEEKRFWRSSEDSSSEAVPLEVDVIKSWRLTGAEDHQKLKTEAEVYWKLSFHVEINTKGIEAWSDSRFRGIWRHWMLIQWRTHKKGNNTIVRPLPLVVAVLLNSCDYAGDSLFRERIWIFSLIGQ